MYLTQTLHTFDYRSVLKLVAFICAGSTAAFALFVLMGKLIYNDQVSFAPAEETFTVEVLGVTEEQQTKFVKPQLPPPPALVSPPPRPTPVDTNSNSDMGFGLGDFDVTVPTANIGEFDMATPSNNEAIAIVQVEPRYPTEAARDGIEGWVTLSFTVDELGQVTDVQVMDAQPKRVFNREAQKALKKWKYRPKVVDGKAVRQPNQSILLEFKLGQE